MAHPEKYKSEGILSILSNHQNRIEWKDERVNLFSVYELAELQTFHDSLVFSVFSNIPEFVTREELQLYESQYNSI